MDWKTTYPALATVMVASLETLQTWLTSLPAPQTDVERTVMRRLKVRSDELFRQELRQQAPGIADQLNDIIDRMERAGIRPPVQRM